MEGLRLGGLAPFSTVDVPGRLAAVLFCQGCPWNCPYCHNAHLQGPGGPGPAWEEACAWLASRRGLLEAVALSGGEPLLQPALPEALARIRELGFQTALHTGGFHPGRLEACLDRLDWVGLDLKGPRGAYARITGDPHGAARAWASLRLLQARRVPFEVRTTVPIGLIDAADLEAMGRELLEAGVHTWVLQPFREAPGASSPLPAPPRLPGLEIRLRDACREPDAA